MTMTTEAVGGIVIETMTMTTEAVGGIVIETMMTTTSGGTDVANDELFGAVCITGANRRTRQVKSQATP
jgi:hypothetical protein